MNIRRHDLKLLVVLNALLTERSITRAAAVLHLSQPAMSAAVSKLRLWVNDPLMVRVTGGYALTARAEQLIEPIRLILASIERAIAPPAEFDPASAIHTFHIAANDAFELIVLPRLVEQLDFVAPNVRLVVVSTEGILPTSALASGEVDFAWGNYQDAPNGFHRQVMLMESLACLVRSAHPTIRKQLTLSKYAAASHILVALKGNVLPALVQRRLAEMGLFLTIGVQVPHILAAPIIVAKSNHVATLPRRVAQIYAEFLDVKVFKIPFALPSYEVSLMWHERMHRDPANMWLRGFIGKVCRTI